ncbi:virA/G regulated protein [Agrobacterium vitis]|uniref:virA/G regulated protein n=1 Tax=Agrobacterium vitis TaxID=373 RepID=UPI0012E8FD2E|nr:virA/G regulated protein [Agrobacterium vitis]MVA53115.1 virA/G regulated protein [Agrobacterium vitis]MVA63201.1 virA/G regulated protein [Agrobacterium vitis]
MRPSGNPNVDLSGSTASLAEVPAGATPVLNLIEPRNRPADDSLEGQTDRGEHPSASFDYDGMKLGAAEREAYENWCPSNRPTWKDLVLRARLDAIDSSAWLPDLGEESPLIFRYEGIPLGEGERQAYKEWQEEAQPTWEDLVVNARMAVPDPCADVADEHNPLKEGEEFRSEASKRKRKKPIDQDENSPTSFYYDGMRLGEPEREAYDNWGNAEPPTWKDLVLKARLDAIDSSAWLFASEGSSSTFEYEGIPLGEGERQAYKEWQEDAQPTWEDLVINARMAELDHPSWITDEHNSLEENLEFRPDARQASLKDSTDQRKSSSASFIYDGMKLGEPEHAAYENWSKPERPSWEALILDARQASIASSSVSNSLLAKTSSPVFLYEGMSLGDAERQAYGRWRQPAQPRWQNLVVNARLADLDPLAWIPDEHDPFAEAEALSPTSQSSGANKSNRALGNQSDSGRPAFAYLAAQEASHLQSPACSQLETRRALNFGSPGPDANPTESIAKCNRLDGVSKIKRLGTKGRRAVNATIHGGKFGAQGLLSEDCGQAAEPSPSEQTTRPRTDNIGTYASRKNERARLATETGKYESEHIFGFKVVHDTLRATKEGRRLERPMPAYLEYKELHRQHVGTGRGRTGLVGRGWPDDASYRADQRATLSDPVASAEGATASNGYQLNQLGYAHQLATHGLQSETPDGVTMPIQVATISYNYTVSRDPVLSPPSKEQAPPLLHLGPRGQTEAVLARETALTGKWPTLERESQVYQRFLALYDVKKDLDAKQLGVRQKKQALVAALNRTAGLIGASPLEAQSSTAKVEYTTDEPDERRVYDPRDRGRDKAFNR